MKIITLQMFYANCDKPQTALKHILCHIAGEDGDKGLLHPVAALHVALRDRQARRRCVFSGIDTYKRALSARADIAIR